MVSLSNILSLTILFIFEGIIRELMMNGGGEEDMIALLGMMHSSPADSLTLKGHILKVISSIAIMFITV